MGDERLRLLERRWRETGAAADEAAWLVERRRAGELPAERLELAAFLEHEAALLAHGPAADPGQGCWFANLLHRFGAGRPLEAVVEVGRLCVPAWHATWPGDRRPGRTLEAALRWTLAPALTDEAARALDRERHATFGGGLGYWTTRGERGGGAAWAAVHDAIYSAALAARADWRGALHGCRRVLEHAERATGRPALELRREAGLVVARRALG